MRVAAFIPARGGSKGIAGKNLRLVGERSLLGRAIAIAADTPGVDEIVVSTDDAEIERAVDSPATVHRRRPEHATDDAVVADAIRDFLRSSSADVVMLLEPTSPFRTVEHLSACLAELDSGADSAATFTEARLNPMRAWRRTDSGAEPFVAHAVPWLPRQQLPEALQLTGAVYAFWADRLPNSGPEVLFGRIGVVETEQDYLVDIDEPRDLDWANFLAEQKGW